MADIHWATSSNGRFRQAGDWIGGVVPSASDQAILDAAGARFIVASDHSQIVAGVQLSANAILQIDRGVFTALDGTGTGQNAGLISIGDGASLAVGGVVNNAGTISLDSFGDPSRLLVLGDTTLTGDGQITLSADGDNAIQAAKGSRTILVNVDDTITGGGVIETHMGGGKLKVVNGAFGVIAVDIQASRGTGKLVNDGRVEAINGNYVGISNMVVTGKGGALVVGQSSRMEILDSSVSGQTLEIAPGGNLYLDGATIAIAGTVRNSGSMYVDAGAELLVDGAASLEGGGYLSLSGQIVATSAATLTNADTIVSSGTIGSGKLGWINQAGGLIESVSYIPGLTIKLGANTFVNAGTIGGNPGMGGITIDGAVDNSGLIGSPNGGVAVTGALINSGTLNYAEAESSVDNIGMLEDVYIQGALVNTGTIYEPYSSGAQFLGAVTGNGAVLIDGGGVDFASSFEGNVQFTTKGGRLDLAQSQGYTGQVTGFTTNGGSVFNLDDIAYVGAGEATFSGTTSSGVLTVTDGTHTTQIALIGDYTTATFTASAGYNNGTAVVATSHKAQSLAITPSVAGFAGAMAGLSARSGFLIQEPRSPPGGPSMLALPHVQTA